MSYESIRKIIPKNSSETTKSPFEIQVGTLEDSLVVKAAKIGVKCTRSGVSWPSIEKEKGIYSWEEIDKAFEVAIRNGITLFITIGYGNTLYPNGTTYNDPKLTEISGFRPEPPIKDLVDMEAFLNFTGARVDHYRDKIDYWEVWNEPNHRYYWGSTPDGKEYGMLLLQKAKLIREIDPRSKIVEGSMAGSDADFTNDFLNVGTDKLIDIISYHILEKINISLNGINFKDPILLDPLTGEVYQIGVSNKENGYFIKDAVLEDYPFMVVERKTIHFN